MGRPRKNQAKPPAKSPVKFVAVRKSSRQIARKQSQDEVVKVNGEVSPKITNDSVNDSHPKKIVAALPRKVGRPRKVPLEVREPSPAREATPPTHKKLTAEDVRKMVIGVTDAEVTTNVTNDQDLWSEDVIEETIICEEMEVEGEDGDGTRYSLDDECSVVLEEVLLVNEPNFEGENVVEFTVIQNEDGTESMVESSMVVTSADETNNHCDKNAYQSIEEGVNSLRVTENSTNEIPNTPKVKSVKVNEKSLEDKVQDKVVRKKSYIKKDKEKVAKSFEGKRVTSIKEDSRSSVDSPEENGSCSMDTPEESSSSEIEKPKEDPRLSKLDDDLRTMRVTEKVKESSVVIDPSDVEDMSSDFSAPQKVNRLRISPLQDSEDSAPMSDKSELSRFDENSSKGSSNDKVMEDVAVNRGDIKDSTKSDTSRGKTNRSNPISARSATGNVSQHKIERQRDVEDVSRDSEIDGKDSEDPKLSSSSENSNDTAVSLNCKIPELNDTKIATGSAGETEKKVGFRSRSGSTDTTGSESGSNSSAVRRSTRIRSLGLMKQR